MKLLYAFIFICIITTPSLAQGTNPSQNLARQALQMGAAFTNREYIVYAEYIYQPILNSMGGIDKAAQILKNSIDNMALKGVTLTKISFDKPSPILKSGSELQATIVQHTEAKLQHGRMIASSTLIAISINNGVDWKFVDTSNKDLASLREALPNLNTAIIIPPPQPPVQYDN